MHSVVGKNVINTRKKAHERSGATFKPSDAVVIYFCHNPTGEVLFVHRVVAAFADMSNYLAQASPSGWTKSPLAEYLNSLSTEPA